MGYCISDLDIPGLAPGEVGVEARRESFVLVGPRDGYLELDYEDIPRLEQILAWLDNHYRGEEGG